MLPKGNVLVTASPFTGDAYNSQAAMSSLQGKVDRVSRPAPPAGRTGLPATRKPDRAPRLFVANIPPRSGGTGLDLCSLFALALLFRLPFEMFCPYVHFGEWRNGPRLPVCQEPSPPHHPIVIARRLLQLLANTTNDRCGVLPRSVPAPPACSTSRSQPPPPVSSSQLGNPVPEGAISHTWAVNPLHRDDPLPIRTELR